MQSKSWIKQTLIAVTAFAGIYAVVVLFFLLPAWISRWENRYEIRKIYDQRLVPTAVWVRDFAARTGRLPSDEELTDYSIGRFGDRIGIYRERPRGWEGEWLDSWPNTGREFLLVDSIPEWNLYYCSWNNTEEPVWTD